MHSNAILTKMLQEVREDVFPSWDDGISWTAGYGVAARSPDRASHHDRKTKSIFLHPRVWELGADVEQALLVIEVCRSHRTRRWITNVRIAAGHARLAGRSRLADLLDEVTVADADPAKIQELRRFGIEVLDAEDHRSIREAAAALGFEVPDMAKLAGVRPRCG